MYSAIQRVRVRSEINYEKEKTILFEVLPIADFSCDTGLSID